MVQSDISGIMFTVNPVSNTKNEIVIETVWGLGEYIVQGIITPDQHIINKSTWEIQSKNSTFQDRQLVKSENETHEAKVPKYKQNKFKIDDRTAVKIAKIGQKLHNHYGKAQDIEFAIEKGKLFIVQTRPITTLNNVNLANTVIPADAGTPFLIGEAASPGFASGPVILIDSPKEINRVVSGQIMVISMTTPDFVPAMKKVSGIITDKGGQTSHAAIVSRELGVPCVVGTKTATKELKEGDIVTLDGASGRIWKGDLTESNPQIPKDLELHSSKALLKTATKLYVNLGEPELAKDISKKNVDGVGLLRAEFMMANIGIHPKRMISEGREKEYIETLAKGILEFCKNFNPRPVLYRTTDFKTNEYRFLRYGKLYEPEEPNPLLGFRGAIRYINSPEVFQMELEAVKVVRNRFSLKNLWLMIPFCRTPGELFEVKK